MLGSSGPTLFFRGAVLFGYVFNKKVYSCVGTFSKDFLEFTGQTRVIEDMPIPGDILYYADDQKKILRYELIHKWPSGPDHAFVNMKKVL